MSTRKMVNNSLLNSCAVNCVKFNPQDMAMASAGADKTAHY